MNKEIDIRSIMVNQLSVNDSKIMINDLINKGEDKYKKRSFNNNYRWINKKATYFIESIFLRCELSPIVFFNCGDYKVICDGFNRFEAIRKFINNELKLSSNGLDKLKFLAGKKFKNLSKEAQEYFQKKVFINILEYSYNSLFNPNKKLSDEELVSLQKEIYIRYNTGIKLETEEIQKAQFENDEITKYFTNKLRNDSELVNKYRQIYLGKKGRNLIESILVDCRLYISSTYAPSIIKFCCCNDKNQRINENYLPNIKNIDSKEIIEDFEINIEYLYNVVNLDKFKTCTNLHNKYFFEVLYWAISVIRKDNLIDISKIDIESLLVYFHTKDFEHHWFNSSQAHYRTVMISRYQEMAEFFNTYYGIKFNKYFTPIKRENNLGFNNVQDLDYKRYHYQVELVDMKISSLFEMIQNERFIIRPSYQRKEVMNFVSSSKIIESVLLNIRIPSLLLYERTINGLSVYEVVDGQQRILSLLAFLGQQYIDDCGNICFSEKNKFALTGLNIYYDLNNHGISLDNAEKIIPQKYISAIQDSNIYVALIREDKNKDFNAKDHFVRLNTNVSPLKNNYYYWNALYDYKIIEKIDEVAQKYEEILLPKNNNDLRTHQFVTNLAYVNFQMKYKNFTPKLFISISNVSKWLNEFEQFKGKWINHDENAIYLERIKYIDAILEIDDFFNKILLWINNQKIDIFHLMGCNSKNTAYFKDYVILYYLLRNINLDDLNKNTVQIQQMIVELYEFINDKGNSKKDKDSKIEYICKKIDIYDTSRRLDYRHEILSFSK